MGYTTTSLQIFLKYACNFVHGAVVSAVNKASLLADKDVVVGVLFTTYTIIGYVSNK